MNWKKLFGRPEKVEQKVYTDVPVIAPKQELKIEIDEIHSIRDEIKELKKDITELKTEIASIDNVTRDSIISVKKLIKEADERVIKNSTSINDIYEQLNKHLTAIEKETMPPVSKKKTSKKTKSSGDTI